MFECTRCGCKTVEWSKDFRYEYIRYTGEVIVHICYCPNCGHDVKYRLPIDLDYEE